MKNRSMYSIIVVILVALIVIKLGCSFFSNFIDVNLPADNIASSIGLMEMEEHNNSDFIN